MAHAALGPYDVTGGSYHIQFFAQPPGGEFLPTEDFTLPLEGLPDFRIVRETGFEAARTAARHPAAYRVPIFYSHTGQFRGRARAGRAADGGA